MGLDLTQPRNIHSSFGGRHTLNRASSLAPTCGRSPLETLEKLEQMRALEAGMRIVVGQVERHARGVDTQEDLDALRAG